MDSVIALGFIIMPVTRPFENAEIQFETLSPENVKLYLFFFV